MEQQTTSFRLSPQQERLWLRDPATDHSRGVFRVDGTLDPERLAAALNEVVAAHEILRTTFARQAGMRFPLQVVHGELAHEWQTVDRSTVPAEEQASALAELLSAAAERPWNLEQGEVLRALLVRLASDRHLLVLSTPSLCADGGSIATIATECLRRYAGEDVAPEPLQYADYAEWQHELLAGENEDAAAARQFWAEQSEGRSSPDVPFLGFPEEPGERQAVDVSLTAEAVDAVEAAAAQYGDSAAPFVQAAWQVVLARLSGADELWVSSQSEERPHVELETAVGSFSRPVPVGVSIAGTSTFAEVAAAGAHGAAQAERWQDYLPPDGANDLVAAFSSSRAVTPIAAGDVSMTALTIEDAGVRAPLELRWSLRDGGWAAEVIFDPGAYDRADAERLAAYVGRVLGQVSARPELEVDEIELLDTDDVRRLTAEVNATKADRTAQTFLDLFARAVERDPDSTAVVDGRASVSYAELDKRANQLAHRLHEGGVGRDAVVALCTDRSVDMVVGLVGISKAGAAYLPLNFEHPPARLEHQLREAGAAALVTQEPVLARLPEFGGEVVCLDRDRSSLDAQPAGAPDDGPTGEQLAYVMYTSGSTGTPKGVGVSHANLANYVDAVVSRLGAEGERLAFGMVTAISTDLGNTAVFPALASGGSLVLVPPTVAADGAAMAAFVKQHPIDVLKITPSHLNALLTGPDAGSVLPRRWLVSGGEALSWDLAARVLELGECGVLNHYGPTETTVGSCTFVVEDGASTYGSATVPIGGPIANTACYVLDERARPVPEGVPGELFIGGAGVARGYVGQPEATAERFVSDPFATESGARMYATGDLARWLRDGTIEFLGREDDQIKIRGFRVEPAEIETALRRVAGVEDALVVLRDDGHGDRRLVAYTVAPKTVSVEELRRGVAEWVPEFMVPSAFVVLDAFPRTPSGKIDRLALPAPEGAGGLDYVAPRTPTEEAVAAIWASVLGLDRVGVKDDFFAIGGHSLLATQIVAQIRSDFSINLPLHALFSSPTVEALSKQIVGLMETGADADTEDLLAELEGLSDEEAQYLLAGESPGES